MSKIKTYKMKQISNWINKINKVLCRLGSLLLKFKINGAQNTIKRV